MMCGLVWYCVVVWSGVVCAMLCCVVVWYCVWFGGVCCIMCRVALGRRDIVAKYLQKSKRYGKIAELVDLK